MKLLKVAASLAVLASTHLGTAWAQSQVDPMSAVPASDWTALFKRSSGWTGADGVYSIPLSGDERPGSGATQRTLIWFSDTFVGTVRPDGSRTATSMVNNTTAVINGAMPDAASLSFQVRPKGKGWQSMVKPPDTAQWFWPNDGVVVGSQVYTFALRMKSADTPPFAFATAGISLLSASALEAAPFSGAYKQVDAPLFVPAVVGGAGESSFGQAVMLHTAAAGAPRADGYLYVFGTRSAEYVKRLLVARVKPEKIGSFAAYRFWDGKAWNADIRSAAAVTSGVSSEFSVHPVPDGRFMLTHMTDTLGKQVAVRYGDSPVGPWGKDVILWDCPEATLTPNTFVYGAKAHPHLSTPTELLVSYHVNTFDFAENFRAGGVEIYRPRFLRVPLR